MMDINNRTDMNDDCTSGYSSMEISPQASKDDLLKPSDARKARARLKQELLYSDVLDINIELNDEKEEQCEFRPVIPPNEIEPYKEWYHKLIMMRSEFQKGGERAAFPPFPPPPLPSTMVAASQAPSVNPFEEVKKAATGKKSSPQHSSVDMTVHRFCPTDFRPLPPPHVFLEMIKTLAPHQYIDLTYALAGAVLLQIGEKVPERFPPLPPKIEPFRDANEEEPHHETEMSSESSSGGEYSDASETTRYVEKTKRERNHQRRAARKIRIAEKMQSSSSSSKIELKCKTEETFPRDHSYKTKTLNTFIPPSFGSRRHQPPFLPHPSMFLPMSPSPSVMMLPFRMPQRSRLHHHQTRGKTKSPLSPVETKKIMLSRNESAMKDSLLRWRINLRWNEEEEENSE